MSIDDVAETTVH